MNLKVHDYKIQIGVDQDWIGDMDNYQKQAIIQLLKREGFDYYCLSYDFDPDLEYFIFQKRVFHRNDEIPAEDLPTVSQVLKHFEAQLISIKAQIMGDSK